MKHEDGWVFNVPVDAKGFGLHDYHTIVKEPMDLGTVKAKLGEGLYESPLDFAEDVRLNLLLTMRFFGILLGMRCIVWLSFC